MTNTGDTRETDLPAPEPTWPEEPAVGRFELLRQIGEGGMGMVWEAWDPALSRRVALKLLDLEGARGRAAARREARCLARVAHPNVVAVFEVGEIEGRVHVVMELVEGPTLTRWCAGEGTVWQEVLTRLLAAGRGLAAVHEAGLAHGDFKPGNVLIGADGRVRVADFGLAHVLEGRISTRHPHTHARDEQVARELDILLARTLRMFHAHREGASVHLTHDLSTPEGCDVDTGLRRLAKVEGTVPYMAPERLEGAMPDPWSDQWSFCVTAWETLFGVRPYAGVDAQRIATAIATGRVQRGQGRPRGMPAAIEAVLRKGLAERPEQRHANMAALLAALEQAAVQPKRQRRLAQRMLVAALVIVLALVGVRRPSEPTRRPEPVDRLTELEQIAAALERSDRLSPVQRERLEQVLVRLQALTE